MLKNTFTASLALFFATVPLMVQAGGLSLDQPWGEHMVVQAGRLAKPAGSAPSGLTVTVRFAGQAATTLVSDAGRWQLELPVPKAGGPYTFSVSAGQEQVDFKDVLVGEVWLGSGQSNMEMPVATAKDADKELANATRPPLRLFKVPRTLGEGGKRMGGEWKLCTPDQAREFSAVAYHFGRSLTEQGIAPVGIVQSAWGGTTAEPWMVVEHVRQAPSLEKVFKRWDALDPYDKAIRSTGAEFEIQYKDVYLVDAKGKKVALKLGAEGTASAENSPAQHKPGRYAGHLGPDAWTTGYAVPAITDWSAYSILEIKVKANCAFDLGTGQAATQSDGDIFAFPSVNDIGPDWRSYHFEIKDLAQRGWGSPQTSDLSKVLSLIFRVHDLTKPPEQPGILFDSMIRPMGTFAFKGVLWYQGESNQLRRVEYGEMLKEVIQGWRSFFKEPTMPFLVVQLPDIGVPGKDNWRDWATLRDQQQRALELENTGVTVNLGLGDGTPEIHPKNKRPVGERLAQEALRIAYGRKGARGHGPRFDKYEKVKGGWQLSFNTFGDKLAKLGDRLTGFEGGVCGDWSPVAAELRKGKVFVADPKGAFEGIRYAWHDSPIATLGDTRKLPAFGFSVELPRKKAKAAEPKALFTLDFEDAAAMAGLLPEGSPLRALTQKSEEVITGKGSMKGDSIQSLNEWNEFYHSKDGLLKPQHRYQITFDYKVLGKGDGCYFYSLVRARTKQEGAGDLDWQQWQGKAGESGKVKLEFSTGAIADYYQIIGIHKGGALSVDNIVLTQVGGCSGE